MTRPSNPELLNDILQLLTEQGTGGAAEGLRLLINEAMLQERSHALQAQPYERTGHPPWPRQRLQTQDHRHADRFHPLARAGCAAIQTSIPTRSKKVSAANQGHQAGAGRNVASKEFLTRKVSAIVEQLCGTLRSVPPRSAIAPPRWTPELQALAQSAPLGAFPYLVLDARYEKVRLASRTPAGLCRVVTCLGHRLGRQTAPSLGVSAALKAKPRSIGAEVHCKVSSNAASKASSSLSAMTH